MPSTRAECADSRLRFRRSLGLYASGLTVVTTTAGGEPYGATCQAFHSVSLEPPLVAVALSGGSTTLAAIRVAGRFAVHVLAVDQEHLSRRFGHPGADRWHGLTIERTPAGLPRLPGALLTLDCRVHADHPAGDHAMLLGRVEWLEATESLEARPLRFHRGDYHHLATG